MTDEVIRIHEAAVFPPLHPHKPGTNWTTWNVFPGRPEHMPEELNYTSRGKLLLELGQVWISNNSSTLWVIQGLLRVKQGCYENQVVLERYRGTYERVIAEKTLRSSYRIWQAFEDEQREITLASQQRIASKESNPFRTKERKEIRRIG